MILPTIYLESGCDATTVEAFVANLSDTTLCEEPITVFVEEEAKPIADAILPALQGVASNVRQSPVPTKGRGKAFGHIAFEMLRLGAPWLFLEPGLVRFNEEGWLPRLEAEYIAKLMSAGTPDHFLGSQYKYSDGPMSPLCGVWPASLYQQSILIRHPSKCPEQDMRWEVRRIFRASDVIGTADKYPVTAKLGK